MKILIFIIIILFNVSFYRSENLNKIIDIDYVELLSFDYNIENGGILLKWISKKESNNNYFSLFVSEDLKSFKEIVRTPGISNSNLPMYYKFHHKIKYKGILYYKLVSTDFNGEIIDLEIIAVDLRKNKKIK
jgi:hypothetical protein